MNVLITGGLGNLGLWITEYLLEQNHNVTVISRSEKVKMTHDNYRFVAVDITNPEALLSVIDGYFDVCIHAASYNEYFHDNYTEKSLQVNALGTEYLCQALNEHGVGKLIYLSTFHVYGASSGVITESSDVLPVNDYGLTHYFAEKYIEKHSRLSGLNFCILRLTNSYGCPKDINTDKWYLVLNDLCQMAFDTKKIVLNSNGKASRDFIWMGDVVMAISLVMNEVKCTNTVYNLSSGRSLSIINIARSVKHIYNEIFNQDLPIEFNISDRTEFSELLVENKKILSVIDIEFNENIFLEAKKIFELLKIRSKR